MEMHKYGKDKARVIIVISVMITISTMLVDITTAGDSEDGLTWSYVAAKEAERVAAINCNHGKAFIDGIVINGTIQCECNTCYSSSDNCSVPIANCSANAAVGDALFLEDYWVNHKVSSAILISGWSRMSYFPTGARDYTSIELEIYIRRLHNAVCNAVVDDKLIVFGNGVTQLLNSFVRALSRPPNNKTLNVVARAPYYPVFRKQTRLLDSKRYEWKGNASNYINTTSPEEFIEFVTNPNNPDGHFSQSVINGSLTITDNVYYWPHFTPITGPLDEDVMMFSMSKFTGHAGSRLGWAFVRDHKLQHAVAHHYMALNSEGSSHDAQQRALILLKDVVKNIEKEQVDHGNDITYYGYAVMKSRWERLEAVISKTDRFSLQSRPSYYCNYMKINRRITPGFAWLRCNRKNETYCLGVLHRGQIIGDGGREFGAGPQHVRLSLIKTNDDFEQLIEKLSILVAGEEPNSSM